MAKGTSEQVMKRMIDTFTGYLEDLSYPASAYENWDFAFGEKTAFVECLEILQTWDKAEENGLDYDIEKKFPIG